jgi:hypothetical protein
MGTDAARRLLATMQRLPRLCELRCIDPHAWLVHAHYCSSGGYVSLQHSLDGNQVDRTVLRQLDDCVRQPSAARQAYGSAH